MKTGKMILSIILSFGNGSGPRGCLSVWKHGGSYENANLYR